MEQKVYRFTSAAKLHRITDPIGKPAPVEGVSLEARLKAARRMRERALAEKAGVSGESREPERRGNFQFSLPPFKGGKTPTGESSPISGADASAARSSAPVRSAEEEAPPRSSETGGTEATAPEPATGSEAPASGPRRQAIISQEIAEGSPGSAETTGSLSVNPKTVESMLPYIPSPVSGEDAPWFSARAWSKLKRNARRSPRADRPGFNPLGEGLDPGSAVELKAALDEVRHLRRRRRKRAGLVRVLAIVSIMVSLAVLLPILKGGFQPAVEALLLSAPLH